MKKERVNEIWGVFFLLLGLFSLASLIFFDAGDIPFYTSHPHSPVHNVAGMTGAYLAFALLGIFGLSAVLIPLIFLLWSGCFFLQRVPEKKLYKFIGLVIALFSTSTLIAIFTGPDVRIVRAGVVGYLAGSHLRHYFGFLGSFIIASSCLLLSVLLATDFLIYPLVRNFMKRLRGWLDAFWRRFEALWKWISQQVFVARERDDKILRKGHPAKKSSSVSALPAHIPLKVKKYEPDVIEAAEALKAEEKIKSEQAAAAEQAVSLVPKPEQKVEREGAAAKSFGAEEARFDSVIGSKKVREGEYVFPSIEFLRRPQRTAVQNDNLKENSRILEETLAEFGIEVKVTEVEQGPVITRYELLPAPGVKVNSIAALSDDIALALKATSVRLIIPIPGKSAVGVEVPNSVTSMVFLRELIESAAFRARKYQLPLLLGKDTSGKPIIAELTAMPHILIAGATGSGKTVCINSIITGLLYYATPDDLKMVMVDPKRVELAVYNKIPHMLSPVVTDVRKAAQTLNWVVNEMENRYKLFATVGVRNIQSFNARQVSEESLNEIKEIESENVVPARLPYIVVVIDELADLMMVAQDKVEGAITRLAQLSRAVGIHLVLATQRPSVDVITGVIKANFPARIAFKVSSKVDSRTVIDANGADKLLGRGDMLFMQPGDAKPIRGQAALVMDEEIHNVVNFLSGQAQPDYHPEVLNVQEGCNASAIMEKDELFDEAVAIVLETGQASASNLQRRLRLGYTRAARILDQMEAEGIIGPAQGAKPRDILVDRSASSPTQNAG